jgi:hypothetical protein
MEIQRLIRLLGRIGDEGGDAPAARARREAARRALTAHGAGAVGPLLAVLWDDDAPLPWPEAACLLRRIGEPALGPLADALVAAPTGVALTRARWAFVGLDLPDPRGYGPALRHPHPRVRESAAFAVQRRGPAALPLAPGLIALLDDPAAAVRESARWALRDLGDGVIGPLRLARRERRPARARRSALEVLAAVGGPAALDARDLAAVRRLIGLRARDEVPAPMDMAGPWFALRTADTAGVLAAFGLSDPVPVTMRLGAAAWRHDRRAGAEHGACSRVYVSPVLDGWTLVFGSPSGDPHEPGGTAAGPLVRRRCGELSRRFGTAHWYGARHTDDWAAWCLAERGEVVRFYDAARPEETTGARHPAEPAGPLPHEEDFPRELFADLDASDTEAFLASYEEVRRELARPGPGIAADVAARASVGPAGLGPRTRVSGRAMLALTACGRAHGHPPGALPI